MCGIAGIVRAKDGPEMNDAVHTMCLRICHRGPDDEGYFSDSRATLGMRRLSIIDLQTGKQPMHNEDSSVFVVFNGEIYNFKEIRESLEAKGHVFHTQSDTEVIPHLYEEYGEEYARHLNGMFGIAIWDSRSRTLVLTRDRLGVKPIYYAEYPDRLIFGSEAKAVLAAPGVSREQDPFALDQYLTYEYIPPPRTIYRELKKLAPGEQLVYRGGKSETRRWWDFPVGQPLAISEEEAAGQLRELLRDSVRLRMISDVPLGVFLSGGVDSSSVTAYASEFSPHIKSFCIGFEEPDFNESDYARAVADAFGTDHHEDRLSLGTAIGLLPEIFDKMDEPLSDPSLLPTYLLSRYTRKYVTVALSGDGGDELFAGYQTYQAHKAFDIYRRLPAALAGAAAPGLALLHSSERNRKWEYKIRKFLSGVEYEAAERQLVWLGPFAPHEKSGIFAPDFYEPLRGNDIFAPVRESLGHVCAGMSDIEKAMFLDLRFYLGENLMTKVDRTSMMHSLEARMPFLDYRFVEFASRLPSHMKLRGLKTKYILKKAVENLVPPFVTHRKKKGFGIPLAQWIRKDLKENFMESLSSERLRADGIFNPDEVQALMRRHLSGAADERKKLWNIFVFQQWKDRWG